MWRSNPVLLRIGHILALEVDRIGTEKLNVEKEMLGFCPYK